MDNISFILAFSAGLLSFLSPCVLPLIPAYVSYLTRSAVAEINSNKAKLNLLYKSIRFITGFTIIFIIMGASISYLGKLLDSDQSVGEKYNISAIPVSVFIDKKGNVVAKKIGAMTNGEMELYVRMLVDGK